MVSYKYLLIAMLLLFPIASQAQDNPFLGKWNITISTPNGDWVYWLEVKLENGALTGYFLNRTGSVFKLQEIAIENGELVFAVTRSNAPKQVHRARVQSGTLVGTVNTGSQTLGWTGLRPPNWRASNANRKHKLGRPVELFNGKSLDNWGIQNKDKPSGWSVVDGVMTNEAGANNLVSKEKFTDFKIRAEYKLEARSNSGIYLRGRYELQVLDDHGKAPSAQGHMSIYSRVAPATNASKPPGEWQRMEAAIVGNRVTVVLNGQKVLDNVVIEGITGGALDNREAEPGPLMLQGDHGTIWFRKITVIPILE